MGTRVEALITSVVFAHALKVRVLHVPDDAPPAPGAPIEPPKPNQLAGAAADPGVALAATTTNANGESSDAASTAPSTTTSTAAGSTTHSRAESTASTAVGDGGAQPNKKGKDGKKDKKDEDEKKKQDLVGRLNSLVTSGMSPSS
jgi:hypothetical protein